MTAAVIWMIGFMFTLGLLMPSDSELEGWSDKLLFFMLVLIVWPLILGGYVNVMNVKLQGESK